MQQINLLTTLARPCIMREDRSLGEPGDFLECRTHCSIVLQCTKLYIGDCSSDACRTGPIKLSRRRLNLFTIENFHSPTVATIDLITCADKEDGGVDLQPSGRLLSLLLEGQMENTLVHIAHLKLP
jgi:hypothetical protein